MTPGDRIRQLRTSRGMTTPQLAELCGVPAPTIYMWEKNKIVPTSEELAAAMRALGVTDEVEDEAPPPFEEATLGPAPDATTRANTNVRASQTIQLPPRISLSSSPTIAKETNVKEDRSVAFDIAAITKAYNVVRDFADGADVIELSTARALLHESLKIVKARLRQLTDDDPEETT